MTDMEWAYAQAVKVQQELEAKYNGDLSQMSKYDRFTWENAKKFIEDYELELEQELEQI